MRVPVKLLGFVFWLFFFHCGQCQECQREDINYENTEPAAKKSYSDGETVRLSCTTGFTGMYRLKCENGAWKTSIERPCAKKKCSHPGDTANGDFKLTEGSEFVFGATVLYTCKKGFEMTSRINQRTCRAQGWDNTLPICEAVTCQAIRTDEGVTASGNTEEGSYGDVIHFECVSIDKKIDGSSDIHCTETGEWSDSVPKCKEITCTAPDISNGYVVEKMQEYKKDAILKYRCSPGFKPREGTPKCAKFGWTLNPECDEVTCELKSATFGVTKIKPEGKTIFRAGESVEITCTEKHWFFQTKENIKSFTCGENGQWDYEPVCAEIRCEVPRDQYVSSPGYYFWGDNKLGVKRSYYCMSGYDQMSAEATCTRDGWTPKPLCADIRCEVPRDQYVSSPGYYFRGDLKLGVKRSYYCMSGYDQMSAEATCTRDGWTPKPLCAAKQKSCRDVSVENGLIYSHPSNEEEIFYSCNTGYKPFTGNWWDSATCIEGSWTEEPRCIPEGECGAFPSVHHGKLKQTKETFRDGDITEFVCDAGFISTPRFITCVRGTWEKPVCEVGVHCKIPLKVENALITSKPEEFYAHESSVTYECRSSFSMNGTNTVVCRNGTWEETPTCEEATCPLNTTVEDLKMEPLPDIEGPVKHGHKLIFSCNGQGLILKGQREITCQPNGEWSSPFPKCEEVMCVANLTVNMRSDVTEDGHTGPEVSVRPGHTITLSCVGKGTKLQGLTKITCLSTGEWNVPFPKCVRGCSEIPEVENAEVSQSSRKDKYSDGDKLDYNCKHGYASPLKIIYTCSNNKWTERRGAKCSLKRCELPEDIPNGQYTIVSGSNFVFGTTIKYICRDGYQMMSRFDTRTCRDGGWDNQLPACEEVSCVPDKTEENMRVEGLPDYDELIKYGHRLTFSCVAYGQILQGPKEITCQSNGQWSSPFPKCIEATCSLNTTVEDLKMEPLPDIEGPVKHGHKLIFSCNGQGLILKGPREITCQSNGEWSSTFPKCEEVMCVANLPVNMRSVGHPGPEVSVRPGHTITLSCVRMGSKLQGHSEITCLPTGIWNVPFPKCVGGKCGPPPQLDSADTKEMTKTEYNSRERVEYTCFNKYTLDLHHPYSKYLTCEQGEWRGNIKCLKPCSVSVEEMDKRGIELNWGGRKKIFSPHLDRITFACQRGKLLIGSSSNLIQYCNDGVMNLPECV
ncbi:complement factor H-like [Siphateles boraxobius]|uniref:complement factor H-like n=1 Tax=Siphateles boraxobius TaxID=180520 RepID=UPI0040647EF6